MRGEGGGRERNAAGKIPFPPLPSSFDACHVGPQLRTYHSISTTGRESLCSLLCALRRNIRYSSGEAPGMVDTVLVNMANSVSSGRWSEVRYLCKDKVHILLIFIPKTSPFLFKSLSQLSYNTENKFGRHTAAQLTTGENIITYHNALCLPPQTMPCHAFYTWASGSDDRGNPIPRIDVNKLIDWLFVTQKFE